MFSAGNTSYTIISVTVNSLTDTGSYMRPILDNHRVRLLFSAKKWTHYTFDSFVKSSFRPLQCICATIPRSSDISNPTLRGVEVVFLRFVFGAILVGSYILLCNSRGNYIWRCNQNRTAQQSCRPCYQYP